jgi:uncharacterized membrane protein YtjA (UPF0391 family)
MIAFGLIILVVSLLSAALGFGGLRIASPGRVFRILFFVCLMVFVGSTIYGLSHPA